MLLLEIKTDLENVYIKVAFQLLILRILMTHPLYAWHYVEHREEHKCKS